MTRGAVLALTMLAMACTSSWKRGPHDRVFQRVPDPILHDAPATRGNGSDWWDKGLHTVVRPLARALSPARWLDRATGGRPALDINAFGQVPDSPWFENRIGRRALTPAQIRRGANTGTGPAPGKLTIISDKTEGATPGLVVRDSRGVVWFVKFDPPAFPEMTTGAEALSARILWAAGYHVPETYLVDLSVKRLHLSPSAKTRDRYNRAVPLRGKQLTELFVLLNTDSKGALRALFSRSVPGKILGPFSYRGIRGDDPNDTIPHQRRRSLRGLWVLAAWLDNTDMRSRNTLDTFVTRRPGDTRGYVKHYLIDFGDALGAAGNREKYVGEGFKYIVDWPEIGKGIAAFGLYYPRWWRVGRSPFRAVGRFDGRLFVPGRWRPSMPNPAFDEATARDIFWAAALVARFKGPLIAAAVRAAEFSETGASAWVTRVLLQRRHKILRWVFGRMLALDNPRIERRYTVVLDDLALIGETTRGPQRFEWSLRWNRDGRGDVHIASGQSTMPADGGPVVRFDMQMPLRKLMLKQGKRFAKEPYLTLTIRRTRGKAKSARIELHLRAAHDYLLPVGLWRQVK